jgi:hypothetical protein
MNQTSDPDEHAMNSICLIQFVTTWRTIHWSQTEQGELENASKTTPNPPWISQMAAWIETRFWGDEKHL